MLVLMNLAGVYPYRFRQTDDSGDLEKGVTQYREALLLCPPGLKSKESLLTNLAFSLPSRFKRFGRMDCLEGVILLYRVCLPSPHSLGSPRSTRIFG